MTDWLVQAAYLVATALFVFALHWMNDPRSARRGVFAGVAAMVLGVGAMVLAVAASMTNIVSGFLITDRMLKMFREKTPGAKRPGAGQ